MKGVPLLHGLFKLILEEFVLVVQLVECVLDHLIHTLLLVDQVLYYALVYLQGRLQILYHLNQIFILILQVHYLHDSFVLHSSRGVH